MAQRRSLVLSIGTDTLEEPFISILGWKNWVCYRKF